MAPNCKKMKKKRQIFIRAVIFATKKVTSFDTKIFLGAINGQEIFDKNVQIFEIFLLPNG